MKSVRRKMKKGIAFSRRLGAVLLAFAVMLVSWTADGFSIRALAAETASGTCGDNVTWVLDDSGTLTISGSGDMKDYSSYSDVPWYSYKGNITRVVINDGVTSIGENAFFECQALTDVDIPLSVSVIGNHAFRGCTALPAISIPESVSSIGDYAFMCCYELVQIAIPDSVKMLGLNAFCNCYALESVTLSNGLEIIPHGAFVGCERITSIAIPTGVTEIGGSAFDGCKGLTEITIPNGVITIGASAFANCTSLTSVSMPDTVTSIGWSAFSKCASLATVRLSENLTCIDIGVFSDCTALTNIKIPDSVTSIGSSAFYGCTGLIEIIIPDSVTSIGNSAFSGCIGLTTMIIPDGANTKNADIPETVTIITYTEDENGNVTVTDIQAGAGGGTVTIPETIGGKTVETVIVKDGTDVIVPETVSKIVYTEDENGNITIISVTPGKGSDGQEKSVTLPDTIGGKEPEFSDEAKNDMKDISHGHKGGTATCNKKAICEICGMEYGEYAEHTWNDGEITRQPTSTETGVITYSCIVCGGTKTGEIAASGGITCGDFTVTGGKEDTDYKYENNTLTILSDTPVTISGTTTTDKIVVAGGVSADITLDNVSIKSDVAFKIEDNSTGNVTVTLVGDNILSSTAGAGLQKNGDENSGTLTINGDGTLEAHCSGGAAIGGSRGNDGCNIVINGGEISGGDIYSAGIGGGDGGNGIVTINGGIIDATSNYGAGIGGGMNGNGKVTINGGKVTVSSNYGAGIGSGDGGNGTVIINGGEIDAYASAYGAAIGSGMYGEGEVLVNGGTIRAETYAWGAGIGGGSNGDGLVIITGGDITASSGNGNDIGGGEGNPGNRSIVVTAEGVSVDTPTGGMLGVIDSNGNITITGYSGGDGVVTIPDSILGYKIVAVNDGIFDSVSDLIIYCESGSAGEEYAITNNISHVTYTVSDDGETTIIEYCGSDTEIVLPETIDGMPLTAIGDGAFANNENLTSIVVPGSVTTVSESAFAGCENLTIFCSDENTAKACADSGVNCMVYANGWDMEYMENPEFHEIIMSNPGQVCVITGFYGSGDVIIPETINGATAAIIDKNAFSDNDGITSVTIPASVKKIVDGAFSGSDNLTIYCEEGTAGADYAAAENLSYITYAVTDSGVIITDVQAGTGGGTVDIPETIGGKTVETVIVKDGTNVNVPETVSKITYTVDENGNIIVTDVQMGTNSDKVVVPDTIGGKTVETVIVKDGTDVDVPETASKITYTEDKNGNVTITSVTPGKDSDGKEKTVKLPETIAGKEPKFSDEAKNDMQFISHEHKGGTSTCTEKAVCEICGEEYGKHEDHSLTKVNRVEPTCTAEGSVAYWTCSKCGKIFSDESGTTEITDIKIPATGHTEVTDAAKEATCTETGLTEGKHCPVCGEVIVAQETVSAKGHTWDDGTITTEPTEDSEGVKKYTCTVCGAVKEETLPKLGHVHEWSDTYSSDETHHWFICVKCGENGEKKDYAEHTWNEGVITKEPTANEAGEKLFTCTVCGRTKTETVPATGGDTEEPTVPVDYKIIDGADGSWVTNSDGSLSIRGSGEFSKFKSVKVDGAVLDAKYYTVTEGSTIINLKAEYLNTLSVGSHTFEIIWEDGTASTSFTVAANTTTDDDKKDDSDNNDNKNGDDGNNDNNDNDNTNNTATEQPNVPDNPVKPEQPDNKDKKTESPKTGDNSNPAFWTLLMLMSMTALAGLFAKKRKADSSRER